MEDPSLQRKKIIDSLLVQQPEDIADNAMVHWDKLADEIISIVGEAGFASLYERSLHQAQSVFPWLTPGDSSLQSSNSSRFVDLGTRLADQAPADACAAHSHLLTIFTDILASLIGEQLTANILRVAWGDLASATAGKELDHE